MNQQSQSVAPHVASFLCYILTFISGFIFLAIEKKHDEVRFHAWQAILFGLSGFLMMVFLAIMTTIPLINIIVPLLWFVFVIGYFILWILLMKKAYKGGQFKLPFIGDIAEKKALS